MSRRITIKLAPDDPGAPVSVDAFVRVLDAIQRATKQIGEMYHKQAMLGSSRAARTSGRFEAPVDHSCALRIAALKIGSAQATLELPPPGSVQQPGLPLGTSDLGGLSLDTAKDILKELSNGASSERIGTLLPIESSRSLVLGTLSKFCPNPSERATVQVWDPAAPRSRYSVRSEVRARMQELRGSIAQRARTEERRFIGRIDHTCRVVVERGLSAPIDPDSAGGYVPSEDVLFAVTAICRVIPHDDDEDEIIELVDVVEARAIDSSPLEIDTIPGPDGRPTGERHIAPLVVPLSVEGNSVVFQHEPLGIYASGDTREEAEEEFIDELAWLVDEYGSATEGSLTPDAIRLKRNINALLAGGGHGSSQ